MLRDLYAGPPHDPLGVNDRWEVYIDVNGQHRWRRFAPNNVQVGASTEGYWNRDNCVWNARRHGYAQEPATLADILIKQASGAHDPFGKNDDWWFYQDASGFYRWRRSAGNHVRVGASSEDYRSHAHCVENAVRHGYVAP